MTTPATADWALPQPGGPDPGSDGLWRRIVAWWAEFSLQTKLLAVATLVVSLVMTGITFLALNGIQRDAVMNDTRYARDLGLLLLVAALRPGGFPHPRTSWRCDWASGVGKKSAASAP